MSYSDLTNNIEVNKRFLRMTSPTIAIYWAIMQYILTQVKAKNKFDPVTGMWKLDRKFVFSETGINTEEQKAADAVLFKLGIITKIDPANPDRLAVDMKKYIDLLLDDTLVPEDLLPKAAKMTVTEQRVAKRTAIKARIVEMFGETDEGALAAITKLVDVYVDRGIMKNAQWEPIIQMLHACTTDPAGISEIVDYVIATNYTSIPAAIDSFMKKHTPTATKLNTKQTTCTGTMKDVEF